MRRLRTAILALAMSFPPPCGAGEPGRWAGVDEKVVDEIASRAGRQRWRTALDQSGDLPLFLFLCAGIGGGFALGYGYRAVFGRAAAEPRAERRSRHGGVGSEQAAPPVASPQRVGRRAVSERGACGGAAVDELAERSEAFR